MMSSYCYDKNKFDFADPLRGSQQPPRIHAPYFHNCHSKFWGFNFLLLVLLLKFSLLGSLSRCFLDFSSHHSFIQWICSSLDMSFLSGTFSSRPCTPLDSLPHPCSSGPSLWPIWPVSSLGDAGNLVSLGVQAGLLEQPSFKLISAFIFLMKYLSLAWPFPLKALP